MILGTLLRLEHILGKQYTLKTIKNKFKSDTEAAGRLYCVAYGDITEKHATECRARGYLLLLPEHEVSGTYRGISWMCRDGHGRSARAEVTREWNRYGIGQWPTSRVRAARSTSVPLRPEVLCRVTARLTTTRRADRSPSAGGLKPSARRLCARTPFVR